MGCFAMGRRLSEQPAKCGSGQAWEPHVQLPGRAAVKGCLIALWCLLACAPASAQIGERVQIEADPPFAIDRTEVTIGQFKTFAAATHLETTAEKAGGGMEYAAGWEKRAGWTWRAPYGQPGADDEPVAHVTWQEAEAFCRHNGGRLPTAREWRVAAYTETRPKPTDGFVAGSTYPYPVGDQPDGMNNSRVRHVAAGTTRRGVNGLYDMGANVWEWLADRRGGDALTIGGSWWYGPEKTRSNGAQFKPADFAAIYIGFRCRYDLPARSGG